MDIKTTFRFIIFIFTLTVYGRVANGQSFTMNTTLLSGTYNSGGCTGVCDMNNDGLDDIVILDESRLLSIAYQLPGNGFTTSYFGTVSNAAQWGMCVGDIDNDGHKDVMCGGAYDNIKIININGPGNYTIDSYPWASIFMQGCNLTDLNLDGYLDGFACHDDGHNVILQNDGSGLFTNGTAVMDMVFYPEVAGGNDNSGNYGSVCTDFDRDGDTDLFIAKCRQFISDPLDPRRTNVLVINNGDGTYDHTNPVTGVSYAQERGLVNLEQSWTSDFADVDNDGDFDCFLTTHSNTLELYENDGYGFFTDRTQGSGLQYSGFFLQAKMHDFDNDGYVDLIHAGGNHDYYHNNGNFTFTRIQNVFVNNDDMHSFGIGDLNHDGYLDVYASYGDGYVDADYAHPDRIFLNNGGNNNWIGFDLQGINSNADAVGAIVEITGSFGTQIREVRAGESYGITNTFTCHFGLGTANTIDQAIVYWPSGLEIIIDNPIINTVNNLSESICSIPSPTIVALGSTNLCPGETVTLMATDPSLTYSWNTGQSGSSITVSEPGNYFVNAVNANGCNGTSSSVGVSFIVEETAFILPDNDVYMCEGSSVTLTASTGLSYLWSNGATSQSIEVTASGDYSVQVLGQCSSSTSNPTLVTVTTIPDTPTVSGVEVGVGQSATFTTLGATNASWYDTPTASTPLYIGSTFTTPALAQTTSYWVENSNVTPAEIGTGGESQQLNNGEGQYQSNSTYYMIFDAYHDVTIQSVNVFASGDAYRTIAVVDAVGNTIASGTFFIPDGASTVDLNFFVPEGTGYGLRSTGNNPQLWRDKNLTTPFDYPYAIGNLASITGTNVTGSNTYSYYYYFYDWVLSTPQMLCSSDRIEVTATVNSLPVEQGCTDISACNFDPQAIVDDGSCTYPGCINPEALNYDSTAGCSDGSCLCEEYTVNFSDNFELYSLNQGVAAQSNVWETWYANSGNDGIVTNEYAFSGTKSVKVNGQTSDFVLPIGPASSGAFIIAFNMLLNSSGGYFNLVHQWSPNGSNYEWAGDVYFDTDGTVTWVTGGQAGGQTSVPLYEWFDVAIEVDLDNDLATLYIANTAVNTWQWSLNNADGSAGQNSIAGMNFFGTNTNNGNSIYYIDNVQILASTVVDCNTACTNLGCTDAQACNFAASADCDNGSCQYTNALCNDGNAFTYGDVISGNCMCAGTPFNYGQIFNADAQFCDGTSIATIQCASPLNLSEFMAQWYYTEGDVMCPSGNSTIGWTLLPGANDLTYTPDGFTGTRTFACFITPLAIAAPSGWANNCVTFTVGDFTAQGIIGATNITPLNQYLYAVNITAGHTYTWSVTNGAIISGQGSNSIQVMWAQSGPYQVSLQESNGLCNALSTLLVVNSSCTIAVNLFSQNGTLLCSGSELTLQATTEAVSPAYEWYLNGIVIPSSNSSVIAITEPGDYQVMITQGTCNAVSSLLSIEGYPAITAPNIILSLQGEGCLNSGAELSLSNTNFSSVLWNTGQTNFTIAVSLSGSYTALVQDVNGCQAETSPFDLNLALEPSVPICLVTVTEGNNNQIVWEPISSEVTSEYRVYKESNVANQFNWIGSVPYGQDGVFTDANSDASTQASRYKLAIIDSCGVESFLTPLHKTIHLTSNLGLNNTVNLIWSHYEGFDFGTYTIFRGDAPGTMTLLTSIASNLNSYTDTNPLAGASYYVIEIEGVSCDPTREAVFSRSNTINLDIHGIARLENSVINVYPNPAGERVQLAVDADLLGTYLDIYDAFGQLILSKTITQMTDELDIRRWPAGVYMIHFRNHGNIVSKRLVKQ